MTREFERLVAGRHRVRHALATTSCTAALHLATVALGLGPGDEVIVPAFTWVTSAHCAEYVGARATFADIDEMTFNVDPNAVRAAITPRTRAIVAVHLFGLAAPMAEIMEIARRHHLFVIEDAACAIGTAYDGCPVGAIGDIGCFSFHPRKVITTGEGGMVVTNDDNLARRVSYLRNHGAVGPPPEDPGATKPWTMARFDQLGFNLRLSDIQAAVGIAQCAKLDNLLQQRRSCASYYSQCLGDVDDLSLPHDDKRVGDHSFQSYVVRVREGGGARRNHVMSELERSGVQTRPGTHAVHRLGYYARKYELRPDDFPRAAMCEDTTITLPIFPSMRAEQQDFIIDRLRAALASVGA
jgi:dTDP-4-amino-4,6-dideoxygalactose transaminase